MKSLNDDLQMRSDWYLPLCTGRERRKINGEKAHATQKPEGLLYRLLLASTNPYDVVLDPFFGTGTSGAVAKKLDRNFIGIERDPVYVKLASERIASIEPAPETSLTFQEPRSRARIPFGNLLEAGLLQPGQTLLFARDSSITAVIMANGNLRSGDLHGSIHGLAKQLSNNAPVNGWDAWLYEVKGHRQTLDTLRQKIRDRMAENNEKHS
jgi:modification methylase